MRSLSNETNAVILDAPDYVLSKLLAAGVAESFTVPAGANYVAFGKPESADFYANFSTTATVPGDVTDGTASELNPDMRRIAGITSISIISGGTPVITAAFYI